MHKIEFITDNNFLYSYSTKRKMRSGMTSEVFFSGEAFTDESGIVKKDSSLVYYISMEVYKKRKQINDNYLKVTGQDGISTLVFAKEAISAFEKFISEEASSFRSVYLAVEWTDNRRRDVYMRGLSSLGFDFKILHGNKVLCKQLM